MIIKIRLMPGPDGKPRPEIVLTDLCSLKVSDSGWLRVDLRNPLNPDFHETRHYPPQQVECIVEAKI